MANLDGLVTANAKEQKGHPFLELDPFFFGMVVIPSSFKLCLVLHAATKIANKIMIGGGVCINAVLV